MFEIERYSPDIEPDPPRDWRQESACLGQVDIMFPDYTDRQAVKAAKAICGHCMVREECMTDAMEVIDSYSVRAGTTPSMRRRLRKEWNARQNR